MCNRSDVESALLRIEAVATAAGYLWEPEERQLQIDLIGHAEVIARRAVADIRRARGGAWTI